MISFDTRYVTHPMHFWWTCWWHIWCALTGTKTSVVRLCLRSWVTWVDLMNLHAAKGRKEATLPAWGLYKPCFDTGADKSFEISQAMQQCVYNMTSIILSYLISTFKSSFFGMCKKATSAAPGMTALETFPDGANVGRWLSTALAKGSVGFRKMTHIHPYPLFLWFPSWIWIGEQKHGLLSWSDAVGLSPLLSTKAPC